MNGFKGDELYDMQARFFKDMWEHGYFIQHSRRDEKDQPIEHGRRIDVTLTLSFSKYELDPDRPRSHTIQLRGDDENATSIDGDA